MLRDKKNQNQGYAPKGSWKHGTRGKNFKIIKQKNSHFWIFQVGLLKKLRHTNIVAYKDSFLDKEQYLNIVMVYCEGGDMYNKIKNQKGKNFNETVLDPSISINFKFLLANSRLVCPNVFGIILFAWSENFTSGLKDSKYFPQTRQSAIGRFRNSKSAGFNKRIR